MTKDITVVLKTGQKFVAKVLVDHSFNANSLSDKAVHLLRLKDGGNLFVQGDNISYILVDAPAVEG